MCGIAGYNFDKEHVNLDNFDNRRQFEALRQAWTYNEHRGRSAAGYFRVGIDDNVTYCDKDGKPAEFILEEMENKLPPSFVFGAHTRAATKGDPKDNKNNHPVFWNGVYVTHNGVIHNDEQLKQTYVKGADESKIPEVDTAAIPILLSLCQPYNYDEVIEALSELKGGYAFHAVWDSIPGLSLIVKGSQYPLIVRYDNRGIFSYSSEDDAQWHMLAAMGIDPNVAGIVVREMDDFSAMWVFNGTPIEWRRFNRNQQWVGTAKSPFERTRILPPSKDEEPVEVYSTDTVGDYAFVQYHSVHSIDSKDPALKLLYFKGEFSDDNTVKDYPLMSGSTIWAKLCEADEIYAITSQDTLHALFGDTELVLKKSDGKLLDVFNHAKFDQQERWSDSEEEVQAAVAEVRLEWDKWLIANSKTARPICTNYRQPEIARIKERYLQQEAAQKRREAAEAKQERKKGGKAKSQPIPFRGQNGEVVGTTTTTPTISESDIIHNDDAVKELPINRRVDMGNFDKVLFQHPTQPVFYFKNLKCQNHKGMLFSDHEKPLECSNIVVAYIAALSCVTDLAVFAEMDPIGFKFEHDIKEDCLDKGHHAWEVYFTKKIWLTDKHYLSIPKAERCVKCDSKFRVREYPAVVRAFEKKEDKSLATV